MDSLEREYRREEDWCGAGSIESDKLGQLCTKHQEQKEAFLKACTLARRTAETFLKYTNRSLQYYSCTNQSMATVDTASEARVKNILEKLSGQENKVLDHWSQRKKRLDQCQQFVLFDKSAKQAMEWIHNAGEQYLNTHTTVGATQVYIYEINSLEQSIIMLIILFMFRTKQDIYFMSIMNLRHRLKKQEKK